MEQYPVNVISAVIGIVSVPVGSVTMDYEYIVINLVVLFAFFIGHTKWIMDVINSQADLVDQIISHLNIKEEDEEE